MRGLIFIGLLWSLIGCEQALLDSRVGTRPSSDAGGLAATDAQPEDEPQDPPGAALCGDGRCEGAERCHNCEADCGACAAGPVCGDDRCEPGESCANCEADCGVCGAGPVCGDGRCEGDESCSNCAQDCGACLLPVCGDGECNDNETCSNCAQDCGPCLPICGDGECNGNESCENCEADCGPCAPAGPICGDGECEGEETCGNCAQDCGACPPVCGDGVCEGGETCGSCEADCGECDWPVDLAQSEDDLLVLLNEQRAVGGNCGGVAMAPAGPLTMQPQLRKAARLHSQDMGENNYFSHQGLDGSSFSSRASRAGYRGSAGGENIAAGGNSAQGTFTQWMNSPGHCQNMLSGRYREIGIGHAYVPRSQYGHYWTQVFGM